jgi:F5/8 type C domain
MKFLKLLSTALIEPRSKHVSLFAISTIAIIANTVASTTSFAQQQFQASATTASNSYVGYPAENAIDNNLTTFWSAGESSANQPWIEIDLGSNKTVTLLQLVVAQYPSGPTTHTISARTASGQNVALGSISRHTTEGDQISFPVNTNQAFRYFRVQTTNSPSWVAWNEITAFGVAPTAGSLTSSAQQCSIPVGASACDLAPVLSASITQGSGRVWVGAAPPSDQYLVGQWVFGTETGSTPIPWIKAGNYRFELREGALLSGRLLATTTIDGVASQPWAQATPKLVSYFFSNYGPGPGPQFDYRSEVEDQSNVSWQTSWDMNWHAAQLNSRRSNGVFLDGTDIFFGGNSLDLLPNAEANWNQLVSQLTISGYSKIRAVFLIDEPDLHPNISDEDIAAAYKIIQNTRVPFSSKVTPPPVAVNYSYVGLRRGYLPGIRYVDWVGFDCYPAAGAGESWDSCGTNDQFGQPISGVGAPPSIPQYVAMLKARLSSAQKIVLFPQTMLFSGSASPTNRAALVRNMKRFQDLAQSDAQIVAVVNFLWQSVSPGLVGQRDLPDTGNPLLDIQAAARKAGRCLMNPIAGNCQ